MSLQRNIGWLSLLALGTTALGVLFASERGLETNRWYLLQVAIRLGPPDDQALNVMRRELGKLGFGSVQGTVRPKQETIGGVLRISGPWTVLAKYTGPSISKLPENEAVTVLRRMDLLDPSRTVEFELVPVVFDRPGAFYAAAFTEQAALNLETDPNNLDRLARLFANGDLPLSAGIISAKRDILNQKITQNISQITVNDIVLGSPDRLRDLYSVPNVPGEMLLPTPRLYRQSTIGAIEISDYFDYAWNVIGNVVQFHIDIFHLFPGVDYVGAQIRDFARSETGRVIIEFASKVAIQFVIFIAPALPVVGQFLMVGIIFGIILVPSLLAAEKLGPVIITALIATALAAANYLLGQVINQVSAELNTVSSTTIDVVFKEGSQQVIKRIDNLLLKILVARVLTEVENKLRAKYNISAEDIKKYFREQLNVDLDLRDNSFSNVYSNGGVIDVNSLIKFERDLSKALRDDFSNKFIITQTTKYSAEVEFAVQKLDAIIFGYTQIRISYEDALKEESENVNGIFTEKPTALNIRERRKTADNFLRRRYDDPTTGLANLPFLAEELASREEICAIAYDMRRDTLRTFVKIYSSGGSNIPGYAVENPVNPNMPFESNSVEIRSLIAPFNVILPVNPYSGINIRRSFDPNTGLELDPAPAPAPAPVALTPEQLAGIQRAKMAVLVTNLVNIWLPYYQNKFTLFKRGGVPV